MRIHADPGPQPWFKMNRNQHNPLHHLVPNLFNLMRGQKHKLMGSSDTITAFDTITANTSAPTLSPVLFYNDAQCV